MCESYDFQYLPNSSWCFVCGEDNQAGLKTRFFLENGVVKGRFYPKPHHCGYKNVVHGGVVAAMLDETMGWAASQVIERMCYTAELTVRYGAPVPASRALVVETQVTRPGRRLVEVGGVLRDESGTQFAQATGRFMPLSVEQTLEVDDQLLYRGGEKRVFDGLRTERGTGG